MPQQDLPYECRFGPFLFHSQIELPELSNVTGTGSIPITIRLGATPRTLPAADSWGPHWINATQEALFTVEETARYHVSHGRQVIVEITPGAPPRDVSGYLLGVVFGILCHQNGMLPLHASAIATGSAVTAFLGNSGAGKSTLAAFLEQRGHRVVSDDICLLAPTPEPVSESASEPASQPGGMKVIPVAGWIKLWRESLDQLGRQADTRTQTFSDEDKYRVILNQPSGAPLHLRNVVLLTKAVSQIRSSTLDLLSPAEAVAEMMNFTYLGFLPNLSGGFPRLFAQCAEALKGTQCFRLQTPWGWSSIAQTVELVERKLLI